MLWPKLNKKLLPIFTAMVALDQKIYPPSVGLPGTTSSNFRDTTVSVITKILLPLVGTIAVLFIIIGGFQYITSGGNEEQAEAGKKTLTNAIIGVIVVVLSYVIITIIIKSLDIQI